MGSSYHLFLSTPKQRIRTRGRFCIHATHNLAILPRNPTATDENKQLWGVHGTREEDSWNAVTNQWNGNGLFDCY